PIAARSTTAATVAIRLIATRLIMNALPSAVGPFGRDEYITQNSCAAAKSDAAARRYRGGVRHVMTWRARTSPPTGFLFRWIHRHLRNEAIAVRHFDLRQTLVVHDVGLADDAVPIEQERRQCVDFVRSERARLGNGHRAVD